MKAENDSAPSTPQTSYTTTQWTSDQIPIDPALQQQSQPPPPPPQQQPPVHQAQSPHPIYRQPFQYQPPTHFQAYHQHFPPTAVSAAHQQPPRQGSTSAGPVVAPQPTTATGGIDNTDVTKLNDSLASAGVDLRAEEETLQRSHDPYPAYVHHESHSRAKKQPPTPAFDTQLLTARMSEVATNYRLARGVHEDAMTYLALSLRARLADLVEAMITAARHRADTPFDRPAPFYVTPGSADGEGAPMWGVKIRRDVTRQLAALERAEREEELRVRKARRERLEGAPPAPPPAPADAEDTKDATGEGPKKKKKKDGPGVTARNMSDDVRKKMSNQVASRAAGLGGRYAWMNNANAASAPAKAKPAAAAPAPASAAGAGGPGGSGSGWARPYVKSQPERAVPQEEEEAGDERTVVTLRDALFVVEGERGHGGGRGSARAWVK